MSVNDFTKGETYEYNGLLLVCCSTQGMGITFHNILNNSIFSINKLPARHYLNSGVINPCKVETEIVDDIPAQHVDASFIEKQNQVLFTDNIHVYFCNRHFSLMVNLSLGTVIKPSHHYPRHLSFRHFVHPTSLSFEF